MKKLEREFRISTAKYWPKDDLVYKRLEQFYNEGVMKGHIFKSTSQPKKEEVLSSIAVAINEKYNFFSGGTSNQELISGIKG